MLLLSRTKRGAHDYVPTELLKEYTSKTNFHCASMPMGRIFISACFFCLNKAIQKGSDVADCPASLVEELELIRDHVLVLNKHGTTSTAGGGNNWNLRRYLNCQTEKLALVLLWSSIS